MSILVLGTVAIDSVKTPAGVREELLGGSAAHFSMSARLFTKVNIVADVGEDFPEKYMDFLRKKDINLKSLTKRKGKTFRWRGEYQGDLNTALTLNTELGVLGMYRPAVSKEQRRIKNVFLANLGPDVQFEILSQMQKPEFIGLDSMNLWIAHQRRDLLKLLKKVDVYVANDQEARDLSEEKNLLSAAKRLRKFGPKLIVIKKGEHGVIFYSDRFVFCLPGYPIEKVIDPTGAGDTFAGGFMGFLSRVKRVQENALRQAVAYGTICASFNVMGFGMSRTAQLSLADVELRLKNFRKIIFL
ncbi:MAG: PfkB family carbohydrate kinase [Candidatus Omnitrophota bacterium]